MATTVQAIARHLITMAGSSRARTFVLARTTSDRYEDLALRLFAEHGGVVLARVRDVAELREWHLLRVPSREAWEAFRSDPRRVEYAWLLERANVAVQRHEVWTVE